MTLDDAKLHGKYWVARAHTCDLEHVQRDAERFLALAFLVGALDYLGARTLLDVGFRTGRTLLHVKRWRPDIDILGVELGAKLSREGHARGLAAHGFVDGDGVAY